MFGKRTALFKQNRVIFRVKKKKKKDFSYSFQHLSLFYFLDSFHTALLQMGRPQGKYKALALHLQKRYTQVKASLLLHYQIDPVLTREVNK